MMKFEYLKSLLFDKDHVSSLRDFINTPIILSTNILSLTGLPCQGLHTGRKNASPESFKSRRDDISQQSERIILFYPDSSDSKSKIMTKSELRTERQTGFALALQPLQWLVPKASLWGNDDHYYNFIIFFVTISFPICIRQK